MNDQDQDQEEHEETEEITLESVLEKLHICQREMEYIKAVSVAAAVGLADALKRRMGHDGELHISSWAHRCHMANHAVSEVAQDLAEQDHLLHELTCPVGTNEEAH